MNDIMVMAGSFDQLQDYYRVEYRLTNWIMYRSWSIQNYYSYPSSHYSVNVKIVINSKHLLLYNVCWLPIGQSRTKPDLNSSNSRLESASIISFVPPSFHRFPYLFTRVWRQKICKSAIRTTVWLLFVFCFFGRNSAEIFRWSWCI